MAVGLAALLLSLGSITVGYSQPVRIQYLLPGNYREDDRHMLELRNTGRRALDLSGWLVITRDYACLLPSGVRLDPGQTYRLAEVDAGGARRPDLVLSQHPGFLIRLYRRLEPGNYAALLNREGAFITGFYYAPQPSCGFLPNRGSLVLPNGDEIPYRIPPETHPNWGYFPAQDDPAIAFERQGGQWMVVPAAGLGRLAPQQVFNQLTVRYHQGIATLKWRFLADNPYPLFVLERGPESGQLQVLDSLAKPRDPLDPQDYVYYDSEVRPGQRYAYRLRYVDPFGKEVRSRLLYLTAEDVPVAFRLEVVPPAEPAEAHAVQFYTAYSQQVKVQLFDNRWKELALLHRNWVEANSQHLLRLTRPLPQGAYTVVATTETERYFKRFRVMD